MSYYIKFRGLNGTVIRYRDTKLLAEKFAEFLARHGVSCKIGTVRPDGQLARGKRSYG